MGIETAKTIIIIIFSFLAIGSGIMYLSYVTYEAGFDAGEEAQTQYYVQGLKCPLNITTAKPDPANQSNVSITSQIEERTLDEIGDYWCANFINDLQQRQG